MELVYTPECSPLRPLFFLSFSILGGCSAKSNLSAFKSMNEPLKKNPSPRESSFPKERGNVPVCYTWVENCMGMCA